MSTDPGPVRILRGRNRIVTDDPADAGLDARARIQQVALELFIEEGYDKTSLREIAEKLGVTKAALYYHFPTKEDIVNSLIEDRIAVVDELLEWARDKPRTAEMRLEFVHRYSEGLHRGNRHNYVMRFFERNQTVVNTLSAGEAMKLQMSKVIDVLSDPTDPPAVQLRRALAIFAVHAGHFILRDRVTDDDARVEAALETAKELLRD
jgi:AcrR family transcriptional regulator